MAATIGFIGTGIMGNGMARQLLSAGHRVQVYNRTRSKAEALADAGAQVADTPAQAARGATHVVTMVSDVTAVEAVAAGAEGLLAGLDPSALWIQMATVGVDGIEELGDLAARAQVAVVDAPVLGTRKPAEEGNLLVLFGGTTEELERCRPVFAAVGRKTVHAGPFGAGSRLKLVANSWVLGLLGVLAESLSLAEHLGLQPGSLLDVMAGGPVDTPYAQIKGRAMLARDYPPSFPLRWALKDARLILDAAYAPSDAGRTVDMRALDGVRHHLEVALERGHGLADMAAVIEGL